MSSLRYSDGCYLRASGTRDAFGRVSDDLVAEGYPPITVVSGDREYAEQVGIFLARYVQAGDVRGRKVYDVRYWNGVAWYRISSAGTVAVPGTSNHESRRAADLGWPYNDRNTAAHRRLQQIAAGYGLKWTGINFGEDWHWENVGALGTIGQTAGNSTAVPIEEVDMEKDERDALMRVDAFLAELKPLLMNGEPGKDLSRHRIDQAISASIDVQDRFIIRDPDTNERVHDLTQLTVNEIKPMLQVIFASIGQGASVDGTPVPFDVNKLAAAIREGLDDDIVDALAARLAKPTIS